MRQRLSKSVIDAETDIDHTRHSILDRPIRQGGLGIVRHILEVGCPALAAVDGEQPVARHASWMKAGRRLGFAATGAASCQLGFVRGTPGSLVGFSGSFVEIGPDSRVRSPFHRVRSQVLRSKCDGI